MDKIDAIIYINLKHRTDRKEWIEKEISRMGFSKNIVHRINAIHDTDCGHLGCGKSHVAALNLAIENKWSRVMILEDDFEFRIDKKDLDTFLTDMDKLKWDVILLALGHNELCEKRDNIRKVICSTTASGYILKSDYYDTLLENFEGSVKKTIEQLADFRKTNKTKFIHGVHAVDQSWTELQKKNNFYTRDPVVGKQANFSSDTF